MAKSFKSRLKIPLEGNKDYPLTFYTINRTVVAIGYQRVVIGKRGPYVEFSPEQMNDDAFGIPEEELYRVDNQTVFYVELRTLDDAWVKLYLQKRTIAYADYKVGMCYASPFDLFLNGGTPII